MLHCHQSQFYEWLPYNVGVLDQVPVDDAGRRDWLQAQLAERLRRYANRYRDLIVQAFGPERGRLVEFIEAFEPCEYGTSLDAAAQQRLFGFLLS